jgi:D-alanyl-lipoteichoic acid acyltransferase DltB (MBOAT superfamily)
MLFNYTIGTSLNSKFTKVKIDKKVILTFGIIANISLLAYFKYADFFLTNLNTISNSNYNLLHLALPLAISFFTFQQIAYLVDSYRQETAEYDFLNYALFVTFFPQLIAGPIVHHKEMMPQFADRWNLVKNYRNTATGLFIFAIGLFKKVVIADTFAVWATNGFDKAEVLNLVEAWATSLSYTFQLYFDFSGYTDMAIGTALLFNIKLPQNFNSPYKAKDIQDFWKRWHITLSRFLRDYIYIPLGGNRVPEYRVLSNLMITFFIGGLWHGAGWTFIFWGFLHGGALIIHKIWKYTGFKLNSMLAWFITFNFINITWVFFRAREWSDALKVLSGMFGFSGIMLPKSMSFLNYESVIITENWLSNIYADYYIIVYILITILALLTLPNSNELKNKLTFNYLSVIFLIIIMVVSFLNLGGVHEFLYFNF